MDSFFYTIGLIFKARQEKAKDIRL